MFLKIHFVALYLTLLISFISADTNDLDLHHQFNNDLKDSNSDLNWWQYFLSATSDTKEIKNVVPLKTAESVAFDVVQTHLTDDEIPDEEETHKLVAPTKSIGAVPAAQQTTTQRPIITTQQAPIKRPVAQPVKRPASQAGVKTATKIAVTTTASSVLSEDDEEELDNNTIVIKPSPKKAPVSRPQTKTRPSQSGTKTKQLTTKIGGPAESQPTLKTTPKPTTKAPISGTSEEDNEEEVVVTTRKPAIVLPKKVASQPSKKPIGTKQPTKAPVGTKSSGGVKSRAGPSIRPVIVTSRPIMTTVRTIVTTTARPIVTTEESEEDEEEPLPVTKKTPVTAPRKITPTTTSRPIVSGVKRPLPVGTKSKQLPTKIGIKQPTKTTQVGTKTRPQPQPAPRTTVRPVTTTRLITTTVRSIVATDAEEDSEDEPLPTARPVPAPQPIPRRSPVSGVKTPIRPQVTTKKVQIQTTSSSPTTDDTDDETESNPATRSPIPSLPRKAPTGVKGGTKTVIKPRTVVTSTKSPSITEEDSDDETENVSERPASPMERIQTQRPQNEGTKTRTGTKTKQVTTKVAPRPVVSQPTLKTTPRPTTTTTEESEEEETSAPSTTTKRPIINGVKRPISQPQPGTKTRIVPKVEAKKLSTTTAKTLIEESEEDEEEIPATRATIRPSSQTTTTLAPRTLRPQVQTTTRETIIANTEESNEEEEEINEIQTTTRKPTPIRPSPRVTTARPQTTTQKTVVTEENEDEEENEIAIPKKAVPAPLPRRPVGTKTPVRTTGTKTIPAVKSRQTPVTITTTARAIVTTEEDSDDDEPLPPKQNVPSPRPQRPQVQTTTRKSIIATTEEADDEETPNEIAIPKKAVPAPLPRRPVGTKIPVRTTGTKTIPAVKSRQTPVTITTTARAIVTTEEDSDDDEPLPPKQNVPSPRPQRPQVQTTTRKSIIATTEEADDEETPNEIAIPKKAVPAPLPRRPVGTKTPVRTTGTKTIPAVKSRQTPVTITTTARAIVTTEEDSDDDEPSTSRPAVPQPRPRGVKAPIGTKTRVTSAPRIIKTTTSTAISEESDDEETVPAVKQPVRPSVVGRRVVTRVTTRPAEVETTTPILVTSTPARRVVSKTRIENMPVPRPVSFSRKSSKTSPPKEPSPVETTTLEPIPVPAYESTRRPTNPIIQSISVDNEEESSENESLALRRAPAKKAISTSDLAKFSSRVRFAERSRNGQLRSQFKSSYSPPLIEPNNEFIKINRIK